MTTSENAERADFYAAAVNGSIITAALLVAFLQEHGSSEATLGALLTTLAVFWLAHIWANVVGERLSTGVLIDGKRLRRIARAEWPLEESAFLPSVPLVLGWWGVIDTHRAIEIATALALVQLLAWGLAAGRRAYKEWWRALLVGLVDFALGVAVVSLELLFVHH